MIAAFDLSDLVFAPWFPLDPTCCSVCDGGAVNLRFGCIIAIVLHLCMGMLHDMLYANAFVSFLLLVNCLANKQHRKFRQWNTK